MRNEEATLLGARLEEILELEREIVLSGQLDKVSELVEEKETVIDQFRSFERPDPDLLVRLNEKLKRNQVLLDHALEGIRVVAKRLSALRRVRNSLETYNANGVKRAVATEKTVTVEKRA
ncbi:MAG: flagellar biosynthesis protein FlgN [Pseudomonadota bacterium]